MAGAKGRSGGHNRKTIAEHKLEGTYRPVRHDGVLQDNPKLVAPEDYIKASATKALLFDRFSDLLHREGLTSGEVDSLYISQIVDLYDAYDQAARLYAEEGVGSRIGTKLAITLMMEIQRELRIQLGEYCLTPATRAAKARSSAATTEPEEDLVAAFFNMRPRLVN